MSHPTMGAWIEIFLNFFSFSSLKSHPTMGAWIEIKLSSFSTVCDYVAPHDGCVD